MLIYGKTREKVLEKNYSLDGVRASRNENFLSLARGYGHSGKCDPIL
jgi:hypothetical protein